MQMIEYLDHNGLYERFQSAYRRLHSTETALLKVHDDIAVAIDNGKSVIFVMLDLSAAFDTVDHDILLSAPMLWNSMPVELKQKDSINSFKKGLKTWLFIEAFS